MDRYKDGARPYNLKLQTGFIVIAIALAISLLSSNIVAGSDSTAEPDFPGFTTVNVMSYKR